LEKVHVNKITKKLREKSAKRLSCHFFPSVFLIAFLAVSLHENLKISKNRKKIGDMVGGR
jgi:hypothetical protein